MAPRHLEADSQQLPQVLRTAAERITTSAKSLRKVHCLSSRFLQKVLIRDSGRVNQGLRGALTGDEIAQTAQFFGFGTNNLTQAGGVVGEDAHNRRRDAQCH
jgi:hypothetical protein